MDLWIRSQDRLELAKVQDIQIHEDEDKTIHIWDYGTWKTYLGQYKTKERALEVLDEIQNALLNKWANNVKYEEHYDDERPRILVYEMPNE